MPSIVWRRRRLFLGVLVVSLALVATATTLLPRTYRATATLVATGSEESAPSEQLVRTYSALARNPNIVDAVRRELPITLTRGDLLDRMTFAPVARTQLLELSGKGSSAKQARTITNTYAAVFASRVRDQLGDEATEGSLELAEPAALPTAPARGGRLLYLALGAALGLLLAVGAAVLVEMQRPRLHVRRDDRHVCDLPILARIPKLGRSADHSTMAEDAFTWLQTSIDHRTAEAPRILAVTSPAEGDGKSTVAAHLALALARADERVILIEGDLRRPRLHLASTLKDVERTGPGLSEHLSGRPGDGLLSVAHPMHSRLHVIWAGAPAPGPAALLTSPSFDALLQTLRRTHDRIIIDTPPLTVGADASIIAAKADGALLVVDASSTQRVDTEAGIEKLAAVRATVLGVVVNRSAAAGAVSRYYHRDPARGASVS
ncbi:MAG: polysaccharide biosynthesis tyrosine autokinase [Solirubrobacterales bacterium]|nr:polysaccharide biosynthesis tyrosine autokinase [Solirubrobacterales bacterium]